MGCHKETPHVTSCYLQNGNGKNTCGEKNHHRHAYHITHTQTCPHTFPRHATHPRAPSPQRPWQNRCSPSSDAPYSGSCDSASTASAWPANAAGRPSPNGAPSGVPPPGECDGRSPMSVGTATAVVRSPPNPMRGMRAAPPRPGSVGGWGRGDGGSGVRGPPGRAAPSWRQMWTLRQSAP